MQNLEELLGIIETTQDPEKILSAVVSYSEMLQASYRSRVKKTVMGGKKIEDIEAKTLDMITPSEVLKKVADRLDLVKIAAIRFTFAG